MPKKVNCIIDDYRKGGQVTSDKLDPHRIHLHGLDGKSGVVGGTWLPRMYHYTTLKSSPVRLDSPKLYEALEAYSESFKGDGTKSLYLWSTSPGTGKTTTAAALMNAWIAVDYLTSLKEGVQPKQLPAVFLDANAFQTQYNMATMARDDDEMKRIRGIIERTQTADFVVLDDVGVRSSTESFRSYLHDIINYRVTNELPTVYTSNLPIEEMADVYDDRLYDRMRDQCGIIHFKGTSNRGRR